MSELTDLLSRSIAMAQWRKRVEELLARHRAAAKPIRVTPRHLRSGPREHVIGCVGCGELLFGWRQDMGLPRCSDCKANDGPRVA